VLRRVAKRRSVKSGAAQAADRHERAKDYLSETEIATLLDGAKAGRHGVRDHLLVLMMYRHGLRVSEAVTLRRDEVDLEQARLWVRRLKNGLSVEQPIAGDELRAIKRYLATRTDKLPWLFLSERGQPLTRQSVNYLVAGAAARVGLPPIWPHMLRHSVASFSPIAATICGSSRIILVTGIRSTPSTTRASPAAGLKTSGVDRIASPDRIPGGAANAACLREQQSVWGIRVEQRASNRAGSTRSTCPETGLELRARPRGATYRPALNVHTKPFPVTVQIEGRCRNPRARRRCIYVRRDA
jgi:type 1 fimbriae regulatory protein FimB